MVVSGGLSERRQQPGGGRGTGCQRELCVQSRKGHGIGAELEEDGALENSALGSPLSIVKGQGPTGPSGCMRDLGFLLWASGCLLCGWKGIPKQPGGRGFRCGTAGAMW